jgi:hypothetical protein
MDKGLIALLTSFLCNIWFWAWLLAVKIQLFTASQVEWYTIPIISTAVIFSMASSIFIADYVGKRWN